MRRPILEGLWVILIVGVAYASWGLLVFLVGLYVVSGRDSAAVILLVVCFYNLGWAFFEWASLSWRA